MEIKPVTTAHANILPYIDFQICSTKKKCIETLRYYELNEEADALESNDNLGAAFRYGIVQTDNSLVVPFFITPELMSEFIARDGYIVATKISGRFARVLGSAYAKTFPEVFTIVDSDELENRIVDLTADVLFEYIDAYKAKAKEKNAEGKTPKKRGRKPKAIKPKAIEDKVEETVSDDNASTGSAPVEERPVEGELDKVDGKEAKTAPVQAPVEKPKKHRGRPRKTAEAFVEEAPTTSPSVEEQAAQKAESIPVEGQEEVAAQIDFGL